MPPTRCQRVLARATVAMCLSVHKETFGPPLFDARGLSVFFALFERVASRVNRDVRSLSSPEWDPASRQGGAFVPGGNVDKRDGLSLFGAEGDQASRAGAKTRGPLWREKGTGRLFLRHSWSGTTPGPRETAGPFQPRKGTARLGGATRSFPSDSVKRRPVPFPRGKRTERLFLRRRNEGGSGRPRQRRPTTHALHRSARPSCPTRSRPEPRAQRPVTAERSADASAWPLPDSSCTRAGSGRRRPASGATRTGRADGCGGTSGTSG